MPSQKFFDSIIKCPSCKQSFPYKHYQLPKYHACSTPEILPQQHHETHCHYQIPIPTLNDFNLNRFQKQRQSSPYPTQSLFSNNFKNLSSYTYAIVTCQECKQTFTLRKYRLPQSHPCAMPEKFVLPPATRPVNKRMKQWEKLKLQGIKCFVFQNSCGICSKKMCGNTISIGQICKACQCQQQQFDQQEERNKKEASRKQFNVSLQKYIKRVKQMGRKQIQLSRVEHFNQEKKQLRKEKNKQTQEKNDD